jgi:hypothetical protein
MDKLFQEVGRKKTITAVTVLNTIKRFWLERQNLVHPEIPKIVFKTETTFPNAIRAGLPTECLNLSSLFSSITKYSISSGRMGED